MRIAPPRATAALIAATVVSWIAQSFGLLGVHVVPAAGFIPARVSGLALDWAAPLWITPLTATMLHGGLLHVGLNMLMLGFTGRAVEAVLGTRQFLLLYVISAYAAAAGQFIASPGDIAPMIGASGAVSGVLAAYVMMYGTTPVAHANPKVGRLLAVIWVVAAWIGIQLLTGIAFSGGGTGIAIAAHIGGFLAGVALTPLMLRLRWRQRGLS
ncbi:rhomboid family intramembrane serine protease [Sphingomonas sp. 1P06PA]|uniref:rhomboid family intramembrane serine protease n=1 Tax=Sphingomonas sp. 1P06PA TaxID=554121 RepID=UPI0039A6EE24